GRGLDEAGFRREGDAPHEGDTRGEGTAPKRGGQVGGANAPDGALREVRGFVRPQGHAGRQGQARRERHTRAQATREGADGGGQGDGPAAIRAGQASRREREV